MSEKLALLGGTQAVKADIGAACKWPHITEEDEQAVLAVLRAGTMSNTDITQEWEKEFAAYLGVDYCLAECNGTAALLAAMFACGVGVGDEIIAPSMTYWATALPCFQLGATVVFADIEPETLNIDPKDIEHRITPRTKAIVPVHYAGYPADMDPIMAIAEKHGLKVIEDVSHAHGGLYKGRITGAIGHVAAMSCMSGKSLVAGEAGMLATNDRLIWERAIAFGHYSRHAQSITDPSLVPYKGYPLGGVKHRVNQIASALGRVQLKHYPARIAEIQKAMNRFWDNLEGCPGIRAHRPPKDSGSTMGGWYAAKGLYRAEELGGLDAARYCEAVTAEGCTTHPRCNPPMHLHPVLNDCDIYGHGKPTRIANSDRDLRQPAGSLPVSERIGDMCY
ncbi:MAG: DegT/DnrJ/EryC1/StrS family aminotransferase, partial [Candidatus Hydrogenedentes bacterium]|nr:DegT/DnrJ/EryC1/StrS family aminotransferase [Candidatus Hydrogenedentota bacterium]